MQTYIIYHPVGGMNPLCDESRTFKKVATISAPSLSNAFTRAQNDFSEAYASYGIRSTSVGDVIEDHKGDHYMVMGLGFKYLDHMWMEITREQMPQEIREQFD
jgi:hypothetical protein